MLQSHAPERQRDRVGIIVRVGEKLHLLGALGSRLAPASPRRVLPSTPRSDAERGGATAVRTLRARLCTRGARA